MAVELASILWAWNFSVPVVFLSTPTPYDSLLSRFALDNRQNKPASQLLLRYRQGLPMDSPSQTGYAVTEPASALFCRSAFGAFIEPVTLSTIIDSVVVLACAGKILRQNGRCAVPDCRYAVSPWRTAQTPGAWSPWQRPSPARRCSATTSKNTIQQVIHHSGTVKHQRIWLGC